MASFPLWCSPIMLTRQPFRTREISSGGFLETLALHSACAHLVGTCFDLVLTGTAQEDSPLDCLFSNPASQDDSRLVCC